MQEKYGEKYFTEEGQGKAGGKFQGLTGHNLHLVTDHTETPLRHGGRPFERPPPSLRLPSSASVNPPSSGTRVAMDEMISSNPRNVLELYQESQHSMDLFINTEMSISPGMDLEATLRH
eukprot:XP_019073001.1 PREDICTED: uncharacterized protein LOC109121853 [Vitis vinifera]